MSYQKPKRQSKIIRGISRLRSQLEKPPIGQRWDKNSNCTELKHIKYFKFGEEGKSIMTLKKNKKKQTNKKKVTFEECQGTVRDSQDYLQVR